MTQPETCRWFALCDNPATGYRGHPVLKDVPICDRCAAKLKAIESSTKEKADV
jgi:hypothetical protein